MTLDSGAGTGEAEAEVQRMEANLFGAGEAEVPAHELAQKATLTEMLAAEAAPAPIP